MEKITQYQLRAVLAATGDELAKLALLLPVEDGLFDRAAACRTLLLIRQSGPSPTVKTAPITSRPAPALLQRIGRKVHKRVPGNG